MTKKIPRDPKNINSMTHNLPILLHKFVSSVTTSSSNVLIPGPRRGSAETLTSGTRLPTIVTTTSASSYPGEHPGTQGSPPTSHRSLTLAAGPDTKSGSSSSSLSSGEGPPQPTAYTPYTRSGSGDSSSSQPTAAAAAAAANGPSTQNTLAVMHVQLPVIPKLTPPNSPKVAKKLEASANKIVLELFPEPKPKKSAKKEAAAQEDTRTTSESNPATEKLKKAVIEFLVKQPQASHDAWKSVLADLKEPLLRLDDGAGLFCQMSPTLVALQADQPGKPSLFSSLFSRARSKSSPTPVTTPSLFAATALGLLAEIQQKPWATPEVQHAVRTGLLHSIRNPNILASDKATSITTPDWIANIEKSLAAFFEGMPAELVATLHPIVAQAIARQDTAPKYWDSLKTEILAHHLPPKAAAMVVQGFTLNVSNILSNPHISGTEIHHFEIGRDAYMLPLLVQMAQVNPGTLFMTKDGTSSLLRAYTDATHRLKESLLEASSPNAINFNPRQAPLFMWCQVMLEDTAHPDVHRLFEAVKDTPGSDTIRAQFKDLWKILNQFIFHIAHGDDIADKAQDSKATDLLTQISFASPEEIATLRAEAKTYQSGRFLDYFESTVRVWQDCVTKLTTLLGPDIYAQIKDELAQLHKKINGSLTYSVKVNARPHAKDVSPEAILKQLPPNMEVEFFRRTERALAAKLAQEHNIPGFTAPPPNEEVVQALFTHALDTALEKVAAPLSPHLVVSDSDRVQAVVALSQVAASMSNALATLPRELTEADFASYPCHVLNERLQAMLNGTPLADHFRSYCAANNIPNHFEEYFAASPPSDLLHLLLISRHMTEDITGKAKNLIGRYTGTANFVDPSAEAYTNTTSLVSAVQAACTTAGIQHEGDSLKLATMATTANHLQGILRYTLDMAGKTNTAAVLLKQWSNILDQMRLLTDQIQDPATRTAATQYWESWERFMAMYALFRLDPKTGAI